MGHDLATLTSTTNEYVGVSFNLGCKRLLYSEWPSLKHKRQLCLLKAKWLSQPPVPFPGRKA